MRNDYFKEALEIVGDPYVLVNMVWGRVQDAPAAGIAR